MALKSTPVLAWLSLALGVAVYLGAVAGLFFAQATPPLDAGALAFLIVAALFGALGLALSRHPADTSRQASYASSYPPSYQR